MAHRLRPVDAGFVESAPVRLVYAREMTAAPVTVFQALAHDVPGWPQWFSAVTLARPTDDGAGREIRLRGGTRFEETILLAEEPEVYAYRVDVTNLPGVRALAEEWRLAPVPGGGTRVRWTFAADGSPLFRAVLKGARSGLGRAFRDAVRTLDRRLAD
ncbi:SRPBCC family protein [Streptomyces sp. NPDC048290]|uniref:SRPBCC family protein n=1 Tax=Streptomyces sp. NPDC048290 TaxID=3155811 RepID=UPI003414072B